MGHPELLRDQRPVEPAKVPSVQESQGSAGATDRAPPADHRGGHVFRVPEKISGLAKTHKFTKKKTKNGKNRQNPKFGAYGVHRAVARARAGRTGLRPELGLPVCKFPEFGTVLLLYREGGPPGIPNRRFLPGRRIRGPSRRAASGPLVGAEPADRVWERGTGPRPSNRAETCWRASFLGNSKAATRIKGQQSLGNSRPAFQNTDQMSQEPR